MLDSEEGGEGCGEGAGGRHCEGKAIMIMGIEGNRRYDFV